MDRLGYGVVASLGVAVLLAGIAGWKYVADRPSAGEQVAALAERLRSLPSDSPQQTDGSARRPDTPAPATASRGVEEGGDGPADATVATAPDTTPRRAGAGGKPSPAAPRQATQVQPPTFDLVQVDENGHVVLAGRAQPGTTVVVLVDGRAIGMVSVDEQGAWAFDTDDEPPLRDIHQLTVRIEDADGSVLARSPQTVTVSMRPVGAGGAPLVVLAAPDEPSRVLQQPASSRLARSAARPSRQDQPVSADPARAEARRAAMRHRAQAARNAGADELARAARLMRQQAEKETKGGQRSAAGKAAGEGRQAQDSTAASVAAAVPTTAVGQEGRHSLTLHTVDYDADGAIFFTGRSAVGAALRLYVNNRHLGDVRADNVGNWQWRGRTAIAPGRHVLRVDRLAADGSVLERIELPFVRADARQIAEARAAAGQAARQPERQPSGKTRDEDDTSSAVGTAMADMPTTTAEPRAARQAATTAAASTDAAAGAGVLPPAAVGNAGKAASVPTIATEQGATVPGGRAVEHGFIVVQPGNNLWNIARVIYGKGVRYTTIYEANRDRIRNPHRIYPGQVFAAPGMPTKQLSIDPRRRRPATPEELQESDVLH